MSKEAKVGMLTGLLVIVLIGVLLSEYLGNTTPPATASGAMASVGEGLRQRQQEPPVVPGMVRDNMSNAMLEPGSALPGQEMPRAMAMDGGGTSAGLPTVNPTAVAVADGMVRPTDSKAPVGGGTELAGGAPKGIEPMMYVSPEEAKRLEALKIAATQPVAVGGGATTQAVAKPVIKGETYVIAKGDTLTVIAKKFYKSTGKADFTRIIAANPTVLKDEKSGLVVGKKLLIPYLPGKEPVEVKPVVIAKGVDGKALPVVVPLPKADGKVADGKTADGKISEGKAVDGKATDPKAAKVYVVAEKDTLERIAKKIGGDKYLTTMKAIKAANGLTDASVLQIGQKLKLPA